MIQSLETSGRKFAYKVSYVAITKKDKYRFSVRVYANDKNEALNKAKQKIAKKVPVVTISIIGGDTTKDKVKRIEWGEIKILYKKKKHNE